MNFFNIGVATEEQNNYNLDDETIWILDENDELIKLEDEVDGYSEEGE